MKRELTKEIETKTMTEQSQLIPVPENRKPFTTPTLEHCRSMAEQIGMPVEEGEKFFYHHDARGWMLGRVKMKNWISALQLWKMNWMKWAKIESDKPKLPDATKPTPMELFLRKEELDRVEKRMKAIREGYCGHQDWTPEDRVEFRDLRKRKLELLAILGLKI